MYYHKEITTTKITTFRVVQNDYSKNKLINVKIFCCTVGYGNTIIGELDPMRVW